jgi:hypothetical protein
MQTQFGYDALSRITLAANDFVTTISITTPRCGARDRVVHRDLDPARQYVLARETSDTGAVKPSIACCRAAPLTLRVGFVLLAQLAAYAKSAPICAPIICRNNAHRTHPDLD